MAGLRLCFQLLHDVLKVEHAKEMLRWEWGGGGGGGAGGRGGGG